MEPVVSFQDMQKMTYEQASGLFPSLQEPVFDALRDLSRAKFLFEWKEAKTENQTLAFNLVEPCHKTLYSIKHMLLLLMNRGHYIFTEDDLDCAYAGMKLFFITDMGIKQGLMKETLTPEGSVDYSLVDKIQRKKVKTHFRAESPQIPQARFRIKTSTIIEP